MENIKELFAEWGLWSLVEDISDDGDGTGDNLQLTKEGSEAQRMIEQELDKAREEGRKELLTQPQTEEETKLVMPPSAYEQAEKEGYDMRKKVKSELIPEDTPEQKEEWEEELGKLMSTWGKVLLVNKGRIGAGMQTAMYLKFYHFIKNLLSEREREVLNSMREWVVEYHKDNWDIRDFDAEIAIGKIIDRELSKLNNK